MFRVVVALALSVCAVLAFDVDVHPVDRGNSVIERAEEIVSYEPSVTVGGTLQSSTAGSYGTTIATQLPRCGRTHVQGRAAFYVWQAPYYWSYNYWTEVTVHTCAYSNFESKVIAVVGGSGGKDFYTHSDIYCASAGEEFPSVTTHTSDNGVEAGCQRYTFHAYPRTYYYFVVYEPTSPEHNPERFDDDGDEKRATGSYAAHEFHLTVEYNVGFAQSNPDNLWDSFFVGNSKRDAPAAVSRRSNQPTVVPSNVNLNATFSFGENGAVEVKHAASELRAIFHDDWGYTYGTTLIGVDRTNFVKEAGFCNLEPTGCEVYRYVYHNYREIDFCNRRTVQRDAIHLLKSQVQPCIAAGKCTDYNMPDIKSLTDLQSAELFVDLVTYAETEGAFIPDNDLEFRNDVRAQLEHLESGTDEQKVAAREFLVLRDSKRQQCESYLPFFPECLNLEWKRAVVDRSAEILSEYTSSDELRTAMAQDDKVAKSVNSFFERIQKTAAMILESKPEFADKLADAVRSAETVDDSSDKRYVYGWWDWQAIFDEMFNPSESGLDWYFYGAIHSYPVAKKNQNGVAQLEPWRPKYRKPKSMDLVEYQSPGQWIGFAVYDSGDLTVSTCHPETTFKTQLAAYTRTCTREGNEYQSGTRLHSSCCIPDVYDNLDCYQQWKKRMEGPDSYLFSPNTTVQGLLLEMELIRQSQQKNGVRGYCDPIDPDDFDVFTCLTASVLASAPVNNWPIHELGIPERSLRNPLVDYSTHASNVGDLSCAAQSKHYDCRYECNHQWKKRDLSPKLDAIDPRGGSYPSCDEYPETAGSLQIHVDAQTEVWIYVSGVGARRGNFRLDWYFDADQWK